MLCNLSRPITYLGMILHWDVVDSQGIRAAAAVAAGIHYQAWEDIPAAAAVEAAVAVLGVHQDQVMQRLEGHQRYSSQAA